MIRNCGLLNSIVPSLPGRALPRARPGNLCFSLVHYMDVGNPELNRIKRRVGFWPGLFSTVAYRPRHVSRASLRMVQAQTDHPSDFDECCRSEPFLAEASCLSRGSF